MAIYFTILIFFTIPPNLHAEELRTLCPPHTRCELTQDYPLITNHGTTIITPTGNTGYDGGIYIQKVVTSFINYGEIITNTKDGQRGIFSFTFNGGQIKTLTNYGYISGGISSNNNKNIHIVNYGTMGGVSANNATITLNNFGTFNLVSYSNSNDKKVHFHNVALTIQNHTMKITSSASVFNNFDGNAEDNSHLILGSYTSVKFADKNSKLILDFGDSFEFGAGYLFNKLVVDTSGDNKLQVDLSRLTPKSDIYLISQNGDKFAVYLTPQHSAISNIYKANIRTMNNFQTMSNSMIYPRKSYHSQNLGRTHSLLQYSPSLAEGARGWVEYPSLQADSAISLKSYETFAYRNESINRRIQRQNKRNYNRKSQNQTQNLKETQSTSQNLNADSANKNNQTNSSLRASISERGNPKDLRAKRSNHPQTKNNPQTQSFSQNLAQTPHNSQTPHDYYFILTPFINHNLFFESGRYNLSGLEYGFLTAFSGSLTPSNVLGTHFMMSYGNIGDSKDKDLSIKSLNLNVGINYKLDLVYDMYLKARGDFFYFSNTLDSLTIKNIKPNNLGFGVSVAYGKDFDFGKGGVLGIEAGIDYKALKTNEISLNSQTYKQSLYNLIYVDLGMSYNKYFGGFGINLGGGFKANLAPKLAESVLLLNTQTLKFTLDNDKYLAYTNAGISYLLNHKDFDMEFSLAYYGNFGDRVISNGGGVEWRVVF